MRNGLMVVACAILVGVMGCSSGDGVSTAESAETAGGGVLTALEVVQAEFAAENDGDPDAILALWSKDAAMYAMAVPEWVGDFDGDGTTSAMDGHVSNAALNPALGKRVDIACTEASETVVECTSTISTAFAEAAGVNPAQLELRFTVQDGLILDQEVLGPVDEDVMDAFVGANQSGIEDYQRWISETHADQYEELFEANVSEMVITRGNLTQHQQMLAEYFETVGS